MKHLFFNREKFFGSLARTVLSLRFITDAEDDDFASVRLLVGLPQVQQL